MDRRRTFGHIVLSLFLAGMFLLPQGIFLQGDFYSSCKPTSAQYLAPRTLTDTPEAAEAFVTHAVQMALAGGVSGTELVQQTRGTKGDAEGAILFILSAIERAETHGIQVKLQCIDAATVRVIFSGSGASVSYLVTAKKQRRELLQNSFAARVISYLKRIGARVVKLCEPLILSIRESIPSAQVQFSPERRQFLAILGKAAAVTAIVGPAGAALEGCNIGEPDKWKMIPGVSGTPIIVDQEKNFDFAVPAALKDAQSPDTSVILRVRTDGVNPANAPVYYRVTASTSNGSPVVLSPFEPSNSLDPTNFLNAIFPYSQEKTLPVRAWLVQEPSRPGDTFPVAVDPQKFPSTQYRPMRTDNQVRPGDQVTFTVSVLEGIDPNHPRIGPNTGTSQPITISEPVTLIRHNGQPEPGTLVSVAQNPDNISNGNDGTLRLTFKTNIADNDPVKPDYVWVSIYNATTNEYLNGHFVRIGNPTGTNQIDIPAVDRNGNEIADGTQLRIVTQNTDIGLTPPDPANSSVAQVTLQRNANPAKMANPTLEADPQTGEQVTLVYGTRLLKLRIYPHGLTTDPLKPTSHFINVTLFDAGSGREVTFGTLVKIPTMFENGVEVPAASQINEYFIEIPENVFSPQIQGSTAQKVEVFNVRPGYASVSSSVVDVSRQVNNDFTSQAKISSTPSVTVDNVQDSLVTLTINPNPTAVSNDLTSAHYIVMHLVNPQTGEAIDVPFYVELPKRLTVDPQTLQPSLIPETNRSHRFTLPISDPAALAFLQSGSANLVSVSVKNVSQQAPAGATTTINPANRQVQLPQGSVSEVPRINSVNGSGDTGVSVNLQVASSGTGGSVPTQLLFFFTLRNSNGERFVEIRSAPLSAAHIADRTALDTYTFTLENSKIDIGTTMESVTVKNQDANLNTSAAANLGTNLLLNPNRISSAPTIAGLAPKAGRPDVAVITFAIPTQEVGGGALPGGRPNVIIEAVTAAGKPFPGTDQGTVFISSNDVQIDPVNPANGVVEFDFSKFGTPTSMENVYFVLRTQPGVGRAFSGRSAAATGSFLVVASASSSDSAGSRRWSREAFSGSGLQAADMVPTAVAAGTVVLVFYSGNSIQYLHDLFMEEIEEEISLMGGISGYTLDQLLERLKKVFEAHPLYNDIPSNEHDAFLKKILLLFIPTLKIGGRSLYIPDFVPIPPILESAV